MAILVNCDCGKQLRIKEQHAGKRIRCSACGTGHIVPPAHRSKRASRAKDLTADDVPFSLDGTVTQKVAYFYFEPDPPFEEVAAAWRRARRLYSDDEVELFRAAFDDFFPAFQVPDICCFCSSHEANCRLKQKTSETGTASGGSGLDATLSTEWQDSITWKICGACGTKLRRNLRILRSLRDHIREIANRDVFVIRWLYKKELRARIDELEEKLVGSGFVAVAGRQFLPPYLDSASTIVDADSYGTYMRREFELSFGGSEFRKLVARINSEDWTTERGGAFPLPRLRAICHFAETMDEYSLV